MCLRVVAFVLVEGMGDGGVVESRDMPEIERKVESRFAIRAKERAIRWGVLVGANPWKAASMLATEP